MFKLLVVILLAVIAFHACADTSLYIVNMPLTDNHYVALVSGTDIYTVNLPVQITSDTYTRVW